MQLPFKKPTLTPIPAAAYRQIDAAPSQLIVAEAYWNPDSSGCKDARADVRVISSVYPIVDYTWKVYGNPVSWDTTTYKSGICLGYDPTLDLTCDVTDSMGNVVTVSVNGEVV